MSLFLHTFRPGVECAENRFDYRKTLVLQGLRHDFLHTFWPTYTQTFSQTIVDKR